MQLLKSLRELFEAVLERDGCSAESSGWETESSTLWTV